MPEGRTFPCVACGAPVVPVVGVMHMACEYCGVTLAIPEELQVDAVLLGSTFKIPDPEPTPEIEAAEFLRAAQPVARKAFNLFALWTWVRRFLPGCITFVLVVSCLCLIGTAILISRQGG